MTQGIVFIIWRDGYTLLEKCPNKPRVLGVGEWFFLGGKIEAGETESDALVREVWEELGLHITAWKPLPIVEGSPVPPTTDRGIFLMRPFLIHVNGPIPDVSLEGVPLRWASYIECLQSPVPQVRAMAALSYRADESLRGIENWRGERE